MSEIEKKKKKTCKLRSRPNICHMALISDEPEIGSNHKLNQRYPRVRCIISSTILSSVSK